MSISKTDKIEQFIDSCSYDDLEEVAYKNCSTCFGKGYYKDDPSPPGLYMRQGDYTHICDCLDEDLILDKFK